MCRHEDQGQINDCSWKEESYETSPPHQWVMAEFSQGEMNATSLSQLHLGPHPLTDETYSTQDEHTPHPDLTNYQCIVTPQYFLLNNVLTVRVQFVDF